MTRKTQGKQDFNLDESIALLVKRGYIRMEYAQTGNAGRPSETIIANPETQTIVNKLNKLKLSPASDDTFNYFNKFTIPTNIFNVTAAADFVIEDDPDERRAIQGG